MSVVDTIKEQIEQNSILLYMKGTPRFPQCGFSARTVEALINCEERFAFVNILENQDIRAELPKYANWPTFPQLWVNGELVGGCDIVCEMAETGDLKEIVSAAARAAEAAEQGE